VIGFLRAASLARPGSDRNRVRVKLNLLKRFNLIWAVQSLAAKYFVSHPPSTVAISAPFRPARGAFRDRHERWARNAVDAGSGALTSGASADGEVVWS